MIRVLLFEDNANFRESLSLYIAASEGMWLLGAFADARESVSLVRKHKPDVVLLDIQMPYVSGIEALKLIKKSYPETKILMQTIHDDDDKIFAAICSGASGYILKNSKPDDYMNAIQEVHAGGSHLSPAIAAKVLKMFQSQFVKEQPNYIDLTPREKEILGCLIKGMSYKLIADKCFISINTVCTHVKHIYEKLHVNSAPEAILKAIELHLI
ncbi:response regulator transcription factor [Dyadobacter sp. CY312]|uniref:response regulator n=1 Tax=Dyadobacter sp. CY312 TaxID=2907303 RepID=UPI001F2A5019|nr:response regulator transcription factor [Dyadobacter sp. CY312]MCE7042043.1 response regulator transcription factor [Dyadobacter sp. CY312]